MAKIRKFAVFIVLMWISVLLSNVSVAQYYNEDYYEDEEELRTFYGGLLLGANFTQVDGDYYAGFRKIGLNAGGIVYAKIGRKIAASMEILFSQKGSRANKSQLHRTSSADSFLVEQYRIDLNYAEVPIMINYFDKRKSHFGAGFSYSQLISSNETVSTDPPVPLGDVNNLYPFKKSDINAVVCLNLHLIKGFFLNYRYQYSLFSIRDKSNYELARANQYNNLHVLRLMYLF